MVPPPTTTAVGGSGSGGNEAGVTVRVGAVLQSGWQRSARPVDQMQPRSPGLSLNGVSSCRVAARRQRRSRTGGAPRTLRYPLDRCLACQQPVDSDAAAQEAALTVYEPRAVVTIRFRVCQPCATPGHGP